MKYTLVLLLAVFLAACGGDTKSVEDPALDDAAAEYKEKVNKRVKSAVVSGLAKEWNVDEDKVECVLESVKLSEMQEVDTNEEVQAVLKDCGVDPAVVK